MTKIWLNANVAENDLVRLDVNIDDVPDNFFGTSFHLKGLGTRLELVDYELGTAFGTEKPFVLVAEKDGALVAGMSFQRENKTVVRDGILITFYVHPFEGEVVELSFDYPILSVFDEGRKDVQTEWLGTQIVGKSFVMSEESESESAVSNEVALKEQVLNPELIHANLLSETGDVTVKDQLVAEGHSLITVYSFLMAMLVFILAVTGIFYLYWHYKKS